MLLCSGTLARSLSRSSWLYSYFWLPRVYRLTLNPALQLIDVLVASKTERKAPIRFHWGVNMHLGCHWSGKAVSIKQRTRFVWGIWGKPIFRFVRVILDVHVFTTSIFIFDRSVLCCVHVLFTPKCIVLCFICFQWMLEGFPRFNVRYILRKASFLRRYLFTLAIYD